MQFDMSNTWQRATDLVKANFQLLAVIAGVFLLLPTLIIYIAVPELSNMEAMMGTPSDNPEKMLAQMGDLYGAIIPWALASMVISFVGYSAMVGLMGAGGITVGDAITRGFKAVPSLIAVMVLFFLAYLVTAFAVAIPIGILGALLGMVSTVFAGIFGLLAGVAVLLASVYLMARFCVTLPVMVLENTLNPVAAMMRSWKLTAPRQWAVFGFWALLIVVYLILAVLLNAVVGLLASLASGTSAALIMGLLSGLIGVLVAMIVSGIAVAIHEQVTGDAPGKISETFE